MSCHYVPRRSAIDKPRELDRLGDGEVVRTDEDSRQEARIRLLVAIANYGHGNDHYLGRLLDEYRSMSLDVDVVVTAAPVPHHRERHSDGGAAGADRGGEACRWSAALSPGSGLRARQGRDRPGADGAVDGQDRLRT